MSLLEIVIYIWCAGLFIGTLIPLFSEQTYWLRAWTYARLQMLALISITLLALIFKTGVNTFLDNIVLSGLMLAALICLRDIFPFTPLASKQVPSLKSGQPHTSISLLVGNVLMDNDNYDAMLKKVRRCNPDIVFLVETNKDWADALSELEQIYAYQYLLPLEEYNGMLFYSKFPITNALERYLVQKHIPSLTLSLDLGDNKTVVFYGVHPRPPRPKDETENLDSELLFVANESGHQLNPVIVTGDLNDVGWSSTTRRFLRVSGLRDPRRGRGLFNSYNAKNPLVRWPLDHVFHSEHFALKDMTRLEASGSDHFPLLIELALVH